MLCLVKFAPLDLGENEISSIKESCQVFDFDRWNQRCNEVVMVQDIERPDQTTSSQRLDEGRRKGDMRFETFEDCSRFDFGLFDSSSFIRSRSDLSHMGQSHLNVDSHITHIIRVGIVVFDARRQSSTPELAEKEGVSADSLYGHDEIISKVQA